MLKKQIKHLFKNKYVQYILAYLLYCYLILVYKTSKWVIKWEDHELEKIFPHIDGCLISFWHNRLAFGLHIFGNYKKIHALVSSHSDGKIIANIIKIAKHNTISGSSNKNAQSAVKSIIKRLEAGEKIIITPDGPRGPLYEINSNITRIAYKYNKPIIPMSCTSNSYFELKSWDKMLIPKPFSKIYVIFGKEVSLSRDDKKNKDLLKNDMMKLSDTAKLRLKQKEM